MNNGIKYKPLWSYNLTPMSLNEASVFMSLVLEESEGKLNSEESLLSRNIIDSLGKTGMSTIFTSQLEYYGLTASISDSVKAYVLLLLNNESAVPVFVDLYVIALNEIIKQEGKVDMENFSFRFSTGFPNHKEMLNAWDDLKLYRKHIES